MSKIPDYEEDLASIRSLMERSVKFISLSGLSGVASGLYALAGAIIAYYLLYYPGIPVGYNYMMNDPRIVVQLLFVAGMVLVLSLGTGYWLSARKAKRRNESVWNAASKRMMQHVAVPLVSGGMFVLVLLFHGYFDLVGSACLLFYGLALIAGSEYTYREVRFLGFSEIALGLLATGWPGYGLLFWATGFGLLHIIYGAVMYKKYDL